MPRIRNIKPAFFRHEGLQDLEAQHPGRHIMLVYIALWTQCDAAGIFSWKPRTLKLDILPFIEFNLEETLGILLEHMYIMQYEAEGQKWGFIPTFDKHQRITGKEATEGEKYPKPAQSKPGNIGETTGKQPDAQERSTGKDNREGVSAHTHEAAPAENFFEKGKNDADTTTLPLGAFASTYAVISAWGESDEGHAELVEWKKITGYRDSQHGPTTDELAKFVSYHLGDKTREENRQKFMADPLPYFRDKFPGWLTNAKAWNRPQNKGKPPRNATEYTPPPNRRTGNKSEPTAITTTMAVFLRENNLTTT